MAHPTISQPAPEVEADANLIDFIDTLQSIDLDSPLASLNATSISDHNGGRVLL